MGVYNGSEFKMQSTEIEFTKYMLFLYSVLTDPLTKAGSQK